MTVTYHLGDTREVTATIPDGSVSLIATSPPFLCLRSYLPADHPLKHADIDSRNRDLYPARREEVARSLFGTKPELPGQLGMFGGDV